MSCKVHTPNGPIHIGRVDDFIIGASTYPSGPVPPGERMKMRIETLSMSSQLEIPSHGRLYRMGLTAYPLEIRSDRVNTASELEVGIGRSTVLVPFDDEGLEVPEDFELFEVVTPLEVTDVLLFNPNDVPVHIFLTAFFSHRRLSPCPLRR